MRRWEIRLVILQFWRDGNFRYQWRGMAHLKEMLDRCLDLSGKDTSEQPSSWAYSWGRATKELKTGGPIAFHFCGFTFVQKVLHSLSFIHSATIRWSWLYTRHHCSSWSPSNDHDMVAPSWGVLLGHFSYGLPVGSCLARWSCQEESFIRQMRYSSSFFPANISVSPFPLCPAHPSVPPRSL